MTFEDLFATYYINPKPIPGLEDLYSVTPDGRVYGHTKKKWLKLTVEKNGYVRLRLSKDNKKFSCYVQRLVALTYIPNPGSKPFVNHIDGNPLNNHITNLEWCTQKENVHHAWVTGLSYAVRGEAHGNTHLNADQVREIRKLAKKRVFTQLEIGRMFGVKQVTVSAIASGRSWGHVV